MNSEKKIRTPKYKHTFNMKFETQEKLVLGMLAAYFIVASIYKFLPAHHLYPFFSWDLYSTIPNKFSLYEIKFYEVDGTKYNPSVSYKELFPEKADELRLFAGDLSVSAKKGDKLRIKYSQEDLTRILGEGRIDYELLEYVYTPFGYRNGESPIQVINLGRFTIE